VGKGTKARRILKEGLNLSFALRSERPIRLHTFVVTVWSGDILVE
jgi:hypothetical protein